MKLASIRDGSRDGSLVIVSRDMSWFVNAPAGITSLQTALDDWQRHEPKLRRCYEDLNNGAAADAQRFNPAQ